MLKKALYGVLGAVALSALASPALARDWGFSFSFGRGYSSVYYESAPVYYESAPVYYAAPVYYDCAPPVVVTRPPVVYRSYYYPRVVYSAPVPAYRPVYVAPRAYYHTSRVYAAPRYYGGSRVYIRGR